MSENEVDNFINAIAGIKDETVRNSMLLAYTAKTNKPKREPKPAPEKNTVNGIRADKSLQDHEKNQEALAFILEKLSAEGSFHFDFDTIEAYHFSTRTHRLVPIVAGDLHYQSLVQPHKLNPVEKIYNYVVKGLGQYAFSTSVKSGSLIKRNYHYDPKTNSLQIFNHDFEIIHLTTDTVETRNNGELGVLFLSQQGTEKIEVENAEPRTTTADTDA
jgi:hypothetical protein